MKPLLRTLSYYLFFTPLLRYLWGSGFVALIVSVALMLMFDSRHWALEMFRTLGVGVAVAIPTLTSGALLRALLSNHHARFLPHFRRYALLGFVLLCVLLTLQFSYFFLPEMRFIQDADRQHNFFIMAAVIFTFIPWAGFWSSRYRVGPLLLWFGFLFSSRWLGKNYRELFSLAAAHPLLTALLITLLWGVGIAACLRTPRIAPMHPGQFEFNPKRSQNSLNFSFLWSHLHIQTPEGAMLYDGADKLWFRVLRLALFVYVFPIVMWLIIMVVENERASSLVDNAKGTIIMAVMWSYMMTVGLVNNTVRKLRLVWLRTAQSRTQLVTTLTHYFNQETIILMALILPLFVYLTMQDLTEPLFAGVFYLVFGCLHWFSVTSIAYATLRGAGSWKLGAIMIASIALLGISFLCMKMVSVYVGLVITGLASVGAWRLLQTTRHHTALTADFKTLRPLRLDRSAGALQS